MSTSFPPPSTPPFGPPPSQPPHSSLLPPPPPRRPQRARFAALVLSGALLVGGAAGAGGAALVNAASDDDTSSAGGSSSSPLTVANDTSSPSGSTAPTGSVEKVAAAVLPSVVELDVSGGNQAGSGSGVILTDDGLILTNNHVVTLDSSVPADQSTVTVSFNDGTHTTGKVVGTDPLTDTALVQAQDVSGLKPITIGKSQSLAVGEQVVAIGSPYGLDSTVTSGIVSALNRPVDVGRDSQNNVTAYPAIQTDAAINPGNSGGALVDMDGHLVGINASIQTAGSSMGGQGGSIGLGFAIPIDEIRPIIDELRNGDTPTHARLGIEVSDAADTSGAQISEGAKIESISNGSAAGAAGLQEGDVITGIDDQPITSSDGLVATVRSYRPGETVKVTYERDGSEHTTDLKLDSDAVASNS
ncbi:S1C family serine protease [Nocardioides panacisoli]|uniref:S1C family serine protease n=1 Tax=Nocardioides panacisoli TaxID=627624 RepID=UPI0031D8F28E